MKEAKKNIMHCPHCGATDISFDAKSGQLRCAFCRSLFAGTLGNVAGGVQNLKGRTVSGGASDIIPDEKTILTLRCPSCGAEVVINTDEVTSARCHWCRHVLTINDKMPNGAVPDLVLPFHLPKEQAEGQIKKFVEERAFFASPKFKREFCAENVFGVYMPYMVVDINSHAFFSGEAEHLVDTHYGGNSAPDTYDADVYDVEREFDLAVDDLTIESSRELQNQDTRLNSNNVINAILPFDTENAQVWDARYLRGFASERRDSNVQDMQKMAILQNEDIARYQAILTMSGYDRGVAWKKEDIKVIGSSWKAAYLPVWLYSYMEKDKNGHKLTHYVAVNARTGEISGSVPVYKRKLFFVASVIEAIGAILGSKWINYVYTYAESSDDLDVAILGLLGFTPGFIFYAMMMRKYRSLHARHAHERQTRATVSNFRSKDVRRYKRERLSDRRIKGENGRDVMGSNARRRDAFSDKVTNFVGLDLDKIIKN